MKKLLTFALIFLSFSVLAQNNREEYIKKAIQLADEGKLEESNKLFIDLYPSNDLHDLVCYNLSVNYFNLNNFARAEKYATECLNLKSGYMMQAAIIKGKCLNKRGLLADEANLYKKMIEKYPKEFIYHNLLARNLVMQKQGDKAEQELQESIKLNMFGSEAHLELGNVNNERQLYIHSLLSYYFFLMTEPKTYRTREIIAKIAEIMNFGEVDRVIAEKTANPEKLSKEDNDLIWSLLLINNLKKVRTDKDTDLPEMKVFVDNSIDIIKNIVESVENPEGFYEEFYVEFFRKVLEHYNLDGLLYYSLVDVYENIAEAIPGVTKTKMENLANFLSANYGDR